MFSFKQNFNFLNIIHDYIHYTQYRFIRYK